MFFSSFTRTLSLSLSETKIDEYSSCRKTKHRLKIYMNFIQLFYLLNSFIQSFLSISLHLKHWGIEIKYKNKIQSQKLLNIFDNQHATGSERKWMNEFQLLFSAISFDESRGNSNFSSLNLFLHWERVQCLIVFLLLTHLPTKWRLKIEEKRVRCEVARHSSHK